MKRRHFLQGALALPWVAGCLKETGSSLEGSLVGANHRLGHRLRQSQQESYSGPRKTVKALIVGGGIAGLSAAWRLVHAGFEDFLVLELESQLGGNSRAARYGDSTAPWAAHYLPVPTRESAVVRRILREMGLLQGTSQDGVPRYAEGELCHAPEERVFVLGRWEEGLFPRAGASDEDFRQLQRFDRQIQSLQQWRDKMGRKAFALPLEFSSREPEMLALDRISMLDYLLQNGYTSPRLHWFIEYACRDDYGTSLRHTSAWAGLHYFACRDGGGFEPRDSQFVWPEGNHRLVQHLAGRLESRTLTGRLALALTHQSKHWWVDVWNDSEGRLEGYAAERVIFSAPTFLRPYLLGEATRPTFTYSPWTVCNLVLERLPESALSASTPLCWDNVLYDSAGLGYVVANHQTASHLLGPSVWTYYRPWAELEPGAARKQMLQASWAQVCQQVLQDLEKAHPDLRAVCRRMDVMQLGHAMIRPLPGFITGAQRQLARHPREGLFFAHSDLSGLSLFEEASFQGVRAAQELLVETTGLKEDFLVPEGS